MDEMRLIDPQTGRKLTWKDLRARLEERVKGDDDFREELLQSPRETLARELAPYTEYPWFHKEVKIHVHEESPTDVHLVLPSRPNAAASDELTDAELELVAGGNESCYTSNPNGQGCTQCHQCDGK